MKTDAAMCERFRKELLQSGGRAGGGQRFTLRPPGRAVGITVPLLCPQSAEKMHLVRELREDLPQLGGGGHRRTACTSTGPSSTGDAVFAES